MSSTDSPAFLDNASAPQNKANGTRAPSAAYLHELVYGPHNSTNPRPDDVSPPEESVPLLVRELFMRAREARRELLVQWKRNYRVLNNRNYRPGANAWDEEPALSQIWPAVAACVSWMTDQRPAFSVTPTAEAFSPYWDFYNDLASDMNTCITAAFQNYSIDGEVTKTLWDVYTYGIGYFKTQWQAPLADGLGDATALRSDPFTIYPDPFARNDSSLSYILEARTMTIADADRAWPGAGKLIGQAYWFEDTDDAPHRLDDTVNPRQPRMALGAITGTDPLGTALPANVPANQSPSNRPTRPSDSPIVTILECYIRGYRTETSDDPGVVKVIDDWRCVVVCGNVVLVDKPCAEISAFNTHPYDRVVLMDMGEWYGPCIVEYLAPIQRLINWVLHSIVRNVYLMGNPVLVEDPRQATNNTRFTNRPGQRLQGDKSATGWLDPPQMHPQMAVELIPFLKGEIESITGLSAMVRGFMPTGRNAQGVIDSIQDAAFVRVRASLRELERSLRGVALKMSAYIAEFYTEARLMSLIGDDGRQTHLSLRSRHFYARDPDDMGKIIPLRFSLAADSGSALPTSKQARSAEAKHLYELGVIDEFELLKAIGWPNYAVVAQRMQQLKQAMAMQEAMAGGSRK